MSRLPTQRTHSRVGLCARCVHEKLIRSSKHSTYHLCLMSVFDPSFARYPTLPVRECEGFEDAAGLTLSGAGDENTGVAAPRITKEDLKQRLESPTPPVLVDARLKYPYEHSTVRLPGAIRYSGSGSLASLSRDREIVVYDSDPNELSSSRVAAELMRQGYRAAALKGGIVDWLAANLPTETKEAPKQAPPEPGALKG
jgi:rhodanese-related sulfurtransferase